MAAGMLVTQYACVALLGLLNLLLKEIPAAIGQRCARTLPTVSILRLGRFEYLRKSGRNVRDETMEARETCETNSAASRILKSKTGTTG